MFPPIWEVWVCMFDAWKLVNLHPAYLEEYLPQGNAHKPVDLEQVRLEKIPHKPELAPEDAFLKAS